MKKIEKPSEEYIHLMQLIQDRSSWIKKLEKRVEALEKNKSNISVSHVEVLNKGGFA